MRPVTTPDVVPAGTHELAWAAGFFEGEGHVGFKSNEPRKGVIYPSVRASVGQVAREPIDRFQRAVGGGTVRPSYTQRSNGGEMWYWQSHARNVIHQVCWLLWPWLGDVKRKQFHAAFEAYHALAGR